MGLLRRKQGTSHCFGKLDRYSSNDYKGTKKGSRVKTKYNRLDLDLPYSANEKKADAPRRAEQERQVSVMGNNVVQ